MTDAAPPSDPGDETQTPAAELPKARLRVTKPWSRGYRRGPVDAFVEDLQRAYRQQPPTMAPYEVADQRFAPTRFGKGYTMRSVDAYLEAAEEQLRRRHGADAVAGVRARGASARHTHFPTELIYLAAGVVILALVVFLALTGF